MSVKLDSAAKPSLTLKRRLKAAPRKVYAAWTEPAQIARWWGPGPASVLRAELDIRVGGRFRIAFRTADGELHDVSGIYREVVPDEKLVFTWAWHTTPERESLVTIDIVPDDDGTWLTLTHTQFFDDAARDGHRRGWSAALDKLEQLFT
jgi:uncharacterized protein YndB with AHSA1/START domain